METLDVPHAMRVLRESSEHEMVACFLQGELWSARFGEGVRAELEARGLPEELLTHPDIRDERENRGRRDLLAATRGYGEDRELFRDFPLDVRWVWARLTGEELARVRYVEYSYWEEISGGSRLPVDAARRINGGVEAFGVSNQRFLEAARALTLGERFPPLIVVGQRGDDLVCLEGNLRLTGYALAGFPEAIECLLGTARTMKRWMQ